MSHDRSSLLDHLHLFDKYVSNSFYKDILGIYNAFFCLLRNKHGLLTSKKDINM
jgi:hypothetical protein